MEDVGYSKLKNKSVKIIFLDGTKINVISGLFVNVLEEYKQILVIDDRTNRNVYISILQIQKIEVLD